MSVMWGCATVVCQTARSQIKFVYGTSTTQPFGPEIEMNECKVPQRSAASSHFVTPNLSHTCVSQLGETLVEWVSQGQCPRNVKTRGFWTSMQNPVRMMSKLNLDTLFGPTQATLNNIHIQWQHVILRHWCLDLLKSQHFHQRCEGKSRPFKSSCKCAAVSTTTRTMLVVHWQWAKNHRQTEV